MIYEDFFFRIFSLWWVVYPSPFTQIYTIDWAAGAPWQNLNNAIGKILQPEIKHKSLWCTTVNVIVVNKIVIKLNNAFFEYMYDVSWLCHRCGDILMGSPLVCIISHSPPPLLPYGNTPTAWFLPFNLSLGRNILIVIPNSSVCLQPKHFINTNLHCICVEIRVNLRKIEKYICSFKICQFPKCWKWCFLTFFC